MRSPGSPTGPPGPADGDRPTAATDRTDAVAPISVAQTIDFAGGTRHVIERRVAAEMPVQVLFSDIPFGVMMMTPNDLDDFAIGFSLTEGVIDAADQIRSIRTETTPGALRLHIDLVTSRLQGHLARRRAMTGRTSCGLCGIEDLAALPRAAAATGPAPRVALGAIARALASLDAGQVLNAATRAVHGAAWAGPDGTLLAVREDVGRHNALDKLIGACLRAERSPADGFIVVTSRASFEMVEKAAAYGARTLVAISAPTALGIERARALDLVLVGIARRDSITVFNGADRIVTVDRPPVAKPG